MRCVCGGARALQQLSEPRVVLQLPLDSNPLPRSHPLSTAPRHAHSLACASHLAPGVHQQRAAPQSPQPAVQRGALWPSMHIKTLTIQGFKSYKDQTSLEEFR